MKVTQWLLLAAIYAGWNLFAYTCEGYIKDQKLIDHIYWFFERSFVIVAWFFVYSTVKHSHWYRYAWLPKTFIWIAILKYIYLLLVVTNILPANKMAGLIGFIFVLTIGFILRKWERLRGNSS